jgi:hypothetical protein
MSKHEKKSNNTDFDKRYKIIDLVLKIVTTIFLFLNYFKK